MERKYRLIAPLGLNARVASLIVGVFNRFANNTITVHYNGEQADGKSILSLISFPSSIQSRTFPSPALYAQITISKFSNLSNKYFK